jgi:hypothetical protein
MFGATIAQTIDVPEKCGISKENLGRPWQASIFRHFSGTEILEDKPFLKTLPDNVCLKF